MEQRRRPDGSQVQVAERVTFPDGHRAVAGYVARKGRTYAHVVTDDGTEVRVPYRLLSRVLGAPRKHVQSRTDALRAQFHAGDRVRFAVGTEVLHGTISRVNQEIPRSLLRGYLAKGRGGRNRGVSPTMPFRLIPRSLLRGGFIPRYTHIVCDDDREYRVPVSDHRGSNSQALDFEGVEIFPFLRSK